MKKGRIEVLKGYWNKKYYSGHIRWLLQDKKGESICCDRCGNIANGIMRVIKRIGVFNVPLCKKHGIELFPTLTHAPFLFEYKPPTGQKPERSVATEVEQSYEAWQIKQKLAQHFGYKSFSEMDSSDQRTAEKVMELLNKEI